MLYLDKYSNRRLMKGREHPHLLLSTITENLFVYAQAFEFFFFKFAARNAGFLREVTVKPSFLCSTHQLSVFRFFAPAANFIMVHIVL